MFSQKSIWFWAYNIDDKMILEDSLKPYVCLLIILNALFKHELKTQYSLSGFNMT